MRLGVGEVKKKPLEVLERKLSVVQPTNLDTSLPRRTLSLCPECRRLIPAEIYQEDEKVFISKRCPDHGEFRDLYYGDLETFERFHEFALDGVGVENPHTTIRNSCPYDCGLCEQHYSHPGIVNIDITNRCNLRCPICFANANALGYVFELDYEHVAAMLELLKELRPVSPPAIQFSGGEPTIHRDFLKMIRKARELGFPQIQVATNGVKLADFQFTQALVDAGLHTVYLQFDGFKEEVYETARGMKDLLEVKMRVIENCRRVKPEPLSTVLVPTVLKGVNDDEVGEIVNFGLENLDVIRAVNFQPVSLSGRIGYDERMKFRYTIGDLIRDLVDQTDYLEKEDFYPVPVAAAISELVSAVHGEEKVAFTCHPACGAATYLFKTDDGRVTPITRFVDVEGLYEKSLEISQNIKGKRFGRIRALVKSFDILRYIDQDKAPKGLNLRGILKAILLKATKRSLADFHWKTLFIGTMHFMDLYNYDVERVKRCVVHYVTPDGRLIPFCAYNTGPTYREEVERKFSIPLEEWKNVAERENAGD